MLSAALQNPWVLGAFAALFVLLALSMFGFYELQLPSGAAEPRLPTRSNRLRGGQLAGVFVMGALSALIVGPCVARAARRRAALHQPERGDVAARRLGAVRDGARHGRAAARGRRVGRRAAAESRSLDGDR